MAQWMIAVRLYGTNELAGIQTGGFDEGGNLSLFAQELVPDLRVCLVGRPSVHPSFGNCSVAVAEAFHPTYQGSCRTNATLVSPVFFLGGDGVRTISLK